MPETSAEEDLLQLRNAKGELAPRGMREGATGIVDLLLTLGVSVGDARYKVAELYSPPRVRAELPQMPNLSLAAGSTFDLRADADGRAWNFLLPKDRRRALDQLESNQYVQIRLRA